MPRGARAWHSIKGLEQSRMTAQCAGRPQVPVAAALLVLATLLSCAAPTSVAFETGPSSVTPAALATGGTHGGNVATVNSGASRSLLARAVQSESIVPGQEFHNWRSNLVAANFSNDSIVANPDATDSPDSSNSSSGGGASSIKRQQLQWINIVGLRDQLKDLPGPRAVNSTHPAAKSRLAAAKKVLVEAAARRKAAAEAQAAAKAATAAAASAAAALEGPALLLPEAMLPGDSPSAAGSGSSGGSSSSGADGQPHQQADGGGNGAPSIEEIELALMSHVRRAPGSRVQLQLNGKPWLMAGFDIPQALALAVQKSKRHQVLYLLDQARKLGFNTIRVWAFADGGMKGVGSAVPRAWEQQEQALQQEQQERLSLQPAPGILNATVLSAGLDWLVHVAGMRGLKLVLVLTDGTSNALGGMKQYTDWVDPALTITDFYTNDTVKSVFLDYIAGMLAHRSSLTGVPLRQDPVIAGWQLAEGATHPGIPSSEPLLSWLKQMGIFLKQKAPHQLVMAGLDGFFGQSSPHHLQHNPFAQVFDSASRSPHPYSAICSGTDFWLHNQLPEIDVATAAVYPDKWLACDTDCKLEWAQGWIRSHLREAVRLQKPLLLTGVGALRPQSWRRQLLELVHSEVAHAVQAGHPMAGVLLSGMSHPDMPDYTSWAIYDNNKAVHRSMPSLADTTKLAVQEVTWRRFMVHHEYLYCLAEVLRGESNDNGEAVYTATWVDGWDNVVAAVGDIGQLTCGIAGAAHSGHCKASAPAVTSS